MNKTDTEDWLAGKEMTFQMLESVYNADVSVYRYNTSFKYEE